jgi:hypothetical protein
VGAAAQGRRVRPAQPPGHDPLPRHGRRGRVGRHGVRPRLRPALRQRERDGVGGAPRRAEDAGRSERHRPRALRALLRVVPPQRPARQPAGVPVARRPRGAAEPRSTARRRPSAPTPPRRSTFATPWTATSASPIPTASRP